MPKIRPSSDLRNKYNEISKFCHQYQEPVYITKNGAGDLAVMSIEEYERLVGKNEFYQFINEGVRSMEKDGGVSVEEAFARVRSEEI